MKINLTHMKSGELGTIVEVKGGHSLSHKLSAMGLREAKRIKKISGQFWGGPQTVAIGSTTMAIGFKMSEKIFVEVKR